MPRVSKANPNRVTFSAQDVANFNATFPCSPIPERAGWVEFDSNGLCDMSPWMMKIDGYELGAFIDDMAKIVEKREVKK